MGVVHRPQWLLVVVVLVVVVVVLVQGMVAAGYRSSPPVSLPADADTGVKRWRRRVGLGCVSLPLSLVLVLLLFLVQQQRRVDHGDCDGDEDDVAASRCVGSV